MKRKENREGEKRKREKEEKKEDKGERKKEVKERRGEKKRKESCWTGVRAPPAAPKHRLLTFLRLSDSLAHKLKGLFVLFAGNLVKLFCELLNFKTQDWTRDASLTSAASSLTSDLRVSADPPFESQQKSSLLLSLVLDCLQKICLYDTNKFLSRERAEFAVALADDSQWKSLNYQILLKTRHENHKVRLSSLSALLELCSRLRENYLVLLPETVPFLAELMEDESEDVEKEVQRVVQEMENVLGEPLQSYF
ncbi:hypothetical protein WMY93_033348 [Mugilogobius chulae]|uniref:HEAT repeat-containing protein 1 n=1 Tax=Mugilogobius chulae TaxID=88201 RepID=A0AAW0MS74_9GOBI